MTRKPYVSDKFYEGNEELLREQIEKSFLGKFGPMEFPCKDVSNSCEDINNKSKLKAIISPHAGYFFSGQCSAHAYKELAEYRTDDIYIILSPNHSGNGYTSLTTENYETPFGIVEIEKDLAKILLFNGIKDDIESHKFEHSLEVQLPFLQYITENFCKIVPIVITGEINSKKLSTILIKSIMEFEEKFHKDVKIIVSSDFTHYGKVYGYRPFLPSEALVKLEEMDMKACDIISRLDIDGFNNFLEDTSSTICGALPILVLMNVLKGLGNYSGELLCYYRSTQIQPDRDNSVSYCALAFFENDVKDLNKKVSSDNSDCLEDLDNLDLNESFIDNLSL